MWEKILSEICTFLYESISCVKILTLASFSLFISSPYRFEHKEQIRPSCGLADQKESYHVSPRKGAMDSRWPTTPETFRDVAEKSMIPEAHKLSLRILSMLERRGCKHLKPGTLEKAHTLWEEDSRCCLRVINYLPMTIDELKDNTQPGNRHWRAAPHTGKYESFLCCILVISVYTNLCSLLTPL